MHFLYFKMQLHVYSKVCQTTSRKNRSSYAPRFYFIILKLIGFKISQALTEPLTWIKRDTPWQNAILGRRGDPKLPPLNGPERLPWQISHVTFMIVWQSWLQRGESLAPLAVCEGSGGTGWREWKKWRRWSGEQSPLICVSREKYKRIESNEKRSAEDCKQGRLTIPCGRTWGKTRLDKTQAHFRNSAGFLSGPTLKQLASNHLPNRQDPAKFNTLTLLV